MNDCDPLRAFVIGVTYPLEKTEKNMFFSQ